MATKKNYVLDTSVYLTDAESIFKFDNHDIFVPLKVLEEIDKHKTRQDSVGSHARRFIRTLDEMRDRGRLEEGVRIGKGLGILKVLSYGVLKEIIFPPDLDIRLPDHTIIATAKAVQALHTNRKTIVVSRDINMRVICDSIGIAAEDYISEKAVTSSEQLYKGFTAQLVDDQLIDRYYLGEEIIISQDEADEVWFPNQYIMMVSNENDKKSALARFRDYHTPLKNVIYKKLPDWKIDARNKEQAFALDLLLNPDIKIVTLTGRAGSGKTLCAIAAGLQQTLGLRQDQNHYTRLIVSRPVQPLGKDIGFLPGTLEEKMLPWLMPIQDNLKFLMGDRTTLEMYIEKGKIEVEALTYIRGRSIANAFIVIDEAQNLTKHEVKTIITRIGEGTKIVLTGDIEQIDNVYVNDTSNGLAHAIEKFKEFPIAGHVTFRKGERSELATLASKVL
ncbi:phosphate starvation-inducible protein PhoH [Candidatus Pacearchaeota archaeon]|nr:phosphate starvation-inducible protein PhoH [Candidatus Pacearchaeota archaeon]|tara:strand:+ start:576 stop:1913 length:1338 start_codon:yes stop_codon:yes gene_type:complete